MNASVRPLDSLERLQSLGFSQSQKEKSIHELSTAQGIEVVPIQMVPISVQCFQYDFSQIFSVVVFAGNEGIQTTCQTINLRRIGIILVIWKYDMEASI